MWNRCPTDSDVIRQQPAGTYLRLATAGVVLLCLSLSAHAFQAQPKGAAPKKAAPSTPSSQVAKPGSKKAQDPDLDWLRDAANNPELMAELKRLYDKLEQGVQYPAPRNQSRILPRLPASTVLYAALPNYGETAHQALRIFQQQLKESPQLQDVLKKNKLDTDEPKIESGIEKFYELSQFLGDEMVIVGKLKGGDASGVLLTEIKKPGLREFLDKVNTELIASSSDRLRIFDPQQLATATEKDITQRPVVLIRPDLLVVGFSVAALREFNSQLDEHSARFESNAFGQRLAQAYQSGTSTVLGLDLHQLIGLMPSNKPQDQAMLEKTGFADVNYFVTSYVSTANEMEVTFNGSRRGIASWIAAPKPMSGLDFVSTHAAVAGDVILKSPVQIFDDVRELAGEAAFASLPQMEDQLKVNLKNDLLSKLTGEIAFEMQPMLPTARQATSFNQGIFVGEKPGPFKLILGVSDPAALQQTLTKLLASAPVQTGQRQEDGITINTVRYPTYSDPPIEINYFFLDGYLVIASDRSTAREAARVHRSGESLAKSADLHDVLSRGQQGPSGKASIILYQDTGRMLAPMLSQLPPELSQLFSSGGALPSKPTLFSGYAEERAIRGFSRTSMQVGLSVSLIAAAVAIPNLMHARNEADGSAAVASVRTVNTAQITYASAYPDQGFASSLATLGPGSGAECPSNPTTAQACLLDNSLAGAECTAGKWCEKSGYKFTVRAVCMQGRCLNYAVTATPADASAGGKSFCSTQDTVIRFRQGPPVEAPLTTTECRAWPPLR